MFRGRQRDDDHFERTSMTKVYNIESMLEVKP